MRKIILLLILVTGISQAQIVNIPDANFKIKLIDLGVDTSMDGEIQVFEAAAFMPVLNLASSGIVDLEGIQAFTNVTSLICNNNQIINLDLTANTNLTFVNCRFNNMLSLDVSTNSNLVDLLADGNGISTLDLPNHPNLETLWVGNTALTSLDMSNCPALLELSCGGAQLTNLNVSSNFLLQDLQCGQNNLSVLDVSNNNNLNLLNCEQNQINTLNVSNSPNLLFLNCGGNDLTSLDVSNNVLIEDIRCWSNLFTTLDFSNNVNLTYLSLVLNPFLETVFLKNGSDESTDIDPGSWLENWLIGNNPSLTYVCADQDQVADIQQWAGADYNVNSYCSFPPGGDYNTITGMAQLDAAADGCDGTDLTIPYMNFLVELDGMSANSTVYTNTNGIYNLFVGLPGTYSLIPNLENPSYFTVSPFPADIPVPVIDNSVVTQDFCVEADGLHPDLEVVIAPIAFARPGFDAEYRLVYKNKGNQTLTGSVDFVYDDAVLDFISATTAPDIQGTGVLTFNFTDLQPFQSQFVSITLNVNSPTETPPVNIGDVLVFEAAITPTTDDETPNDNVFVYDEVVIGSYDPNNIVCIQGDVVPDTFIGAYLHYVINFENTGTAPAENVVVTTEINPLDFDINSLQILDASHVMDVSFEDNLVTFNFRMIQLDTGGHGNILLKLRTLSDLAITDMVTTQAAIYFDFNFPIQTNEANTSFETLGTTTFASQEAIKVFPNPAEDRVFIQAATAIETITMYDVQGRVVAAQEVSGTNTSISLSLLSAGVYFVNIKTATGELVKKVLKK